MTRSIAALGAVFFALVALSACGSSSAIPGDAVATVGGTPITMATFNHWMTIAANSSQQSATGATTKQVVPVPPDYTACIASLKTQIAALLKGKKAPTTAQLKSECAQEYTSYQSQVMQFLLSAEWVFGEAAADKITVTDKAVTTQFATIKKQQFPTAAAYTAFLASSGETLADLLLRVKLELLSTQLRNKATKGSGTPTSAQVAAYYAAHKSTYGTPESLDLSIILTKTQPAATAALAKINSGTPFATVAESDSIDVATKKIGGALTGVVRGQEEQALDSAIFAAPLNKLGGPIKTPFGYYIFKVTKITPAVQQPLASVAATIKSTLASTQQQAALTKFVAAFTKRWTAKTNCRTGFVVQDCSSYKAPKTTTATSATTTG
jgi:foldase protein PrsA